ncbi:hypothetical protein [Brenneria uluponensis]|uniref:hypothetical protein n=1 Tax=Brenneria uluponensis TaxID=3057057 RepID=UPI0028E99B3E|nr:hypothetical protein [Brenneria ulupoensis]
MEKTHGDRELFRPSGSTNLWFCICCPHRPNSRNADKKKSTHGPYDAMLAGHARSVGLILVTNNAHAF